MPKLSDVFVNNFINSSTVPTFPLTIVRVDEEDIGGETKLVAYFREITQGWPMNRTNAEHIGEAIGDDDTDNWGGVVVTLCRGRTVYRGRKVNCIAVASVTAATTAAPAGRKKGTEEYLG